MAVYGYVRVSTSEQAAGGQSLAAQREKIALQARMMDKSVDRIFSDPGVSGSRPLDDRPGGKALLDAVKPGDSVIAVKLDRMFRSAGDALATLQTFKAKGAKLHLLDLGGDDCAGNGISGLVFTIMSAVAQFERERIAERIADAKAKDRADGRFLGGSRPFGWGKAEDGETMVPVPAEQAAIAKAKEMREAGASLRAIAAALQDDGHDVSHVTAGKLVKRPAAQEPGGM